MTDMLVRLYDLEPLQANPIQGVTLRHAIAPEKHIVVAWVRTYFSALWASECDVCFSNHPVSCIIAHEGNSILGFACYNATALGFFGPTGVLETQRGRGIGAQLLLSALHAMRNQGYGYAIIGGVGPSDFYRKVAGAIEIPDSSPGIYRGMLHS